MSDTTKKRRWSKKPDGAAKGRLIGLHRVDDGRWEATLGGKKIEISHDADKGVWTARSGKSVIERAPNFRQIIGDLRVRARNG